MPMEWEEEEEGDGCAHRLLVSLDEGSFLLTAVVSTQRGGKEMFKLMHTTLAMNPIKAHHTNNESN